MPAQPAEDPQELLRRRIDSFRATGDTAILDETSTAAAAEVWQASFDPSSGAVAISAVHLIAWFHWCRSDAAGARGEADLHGAVDLFRMLFGARPELVPEPIARRLRTESNPTELSRCAPTTWCGAPDRETTATCSTTRSPSCAGPCGRRRRPRSAWTPRTS
jgi:hypothetical protein